MIAHRFDTTTERLIELNAGQYPSLLDTPNYVEVGWVIIVAIEPPATPVPIPTPFSNTPGCDVSNIYWLEPPITCQRYTVELVTDVSLSIACVVLDDNPLGYYKTVTIRKVGT
ncbi:MAG: hypothetical protein IPH82_29055 [Chloroflexi bacterium]|nr:hypothetical protein [Chloroflexota bacterium]